MRHQFLAFAFTMAAVPGVIGQNPAKPAGSATSQSPGASVTVEGCVMKEVDVPGRRPPENLRSQAEADDEYVLTNTSVISGTAPAAPAAAAAGGAATGTSCSTSAGLLYDIEGISKTELRKQIGKRVQIEGVLDHPEHAKLAVSFANKLVELKGTTIRSVSGACATK